MVAFGRADGKTCPITMPVPKGFDDVEVFVPKQATAVMESNTTVNPTGQAGDEVCPDSDCDTGGDTSVICACVDLAKYDLADGQQWHLPACHFVGNHLVLCHCHVAGRGIHGVLLDQTWQLIAFVLGINLSVQGRE